MKMRMLLLAVMASVSARADEDMTGARQLRMANCPSAVDGAVTEVSDMVNGVVVTVRAPDDPIAAEEIRRRVRLRLETAEAPERGAIEHTGLGTGSGRYGYCPGITENTRFDVMWRTDGARMYVRADDDAAVRRLQRSTRRRAAALAARRRSSAAR